MKWTRFFRIGQLIAMTLLLCQVEVMVSAAAGITPDSFRYRVQQEISMEPDSPFFVMELDPAVSATMDPSLRDVRVFADEMELGYIPITVPSPNNQAMEQPLSIRNKGILEDGTHSFTLALPRPLSATPSLRIKLQEDPYLVKGMLYGSEDNSQWLKLRSVTLFGIDGRFNDISLSGIDLNYLKFEYKTLPGEKNEIVDAVLLKSKQEDAFSSWDTVTMEAENKEKETILTLDLFDAHRISSEWVIDVKDKAFSRQVRMEGSHDKTAWEPLGMTYIYRSPEPGDDKMSFIYSSAHFRYLRLTTSNEDNTPLAVTSVKVRTHPVLLLVKAPSSVSESQMSITVAWGNPNMAPPSYDVASLIDKVKIEQLPVTRIKSYEENPSYDPTGHLPLTERYRHLIPFGLAGAVCLVGYFICRNMKQMQI